MNKPKLMQRYGGYICTGVHVPTKLQITRWSKTSEVAYEEYLKAYEEVERMMQKAKMHGAIAHIPVNKLAEIIDPVLFSGKGTGNVEAVDYTRPAYPSYDIYENAEEQDRSNEKILQCYVGVLGLLVIAMFVGIALS